MKTILIGLTFTMLGISLNGYLTALHHNLFDVRYEACKAKLIAENNYKTQEQVIECTTCTAGMKILGTILFADGSVLE